MGELFLKLLDMSITASWLILVVVLLRLVLKKAPKWVHCILWALVAVRLICPFSFESKLSLVPDTGIGDTVNVVVSQMGKAEMQDAIEMIGGVDGLIVTDEAEIGGSIVSSGDSGISGTEPVGITSIGVADIAAAVWLGGAVVLLLYALISYLRLRKRVAAAMPLGDNVWLCDAVESPFILGFFRPRIYLPSNISEGDMEHVLAHERAHLQRRDHWWKPLGYVLLAVYWFNPLIWVAYILLCRDIELACDEKVINRPDTDRRAYSEALLACSVKRSAITACPLAFGEVSVRGRIKSVLNYKKPAFWIILVALVACIVAAVCFLTDPLAPTFRDVKNQNGYGITAMVTNRHVRINVPKAELPDDIYTQKGHEFELGEVVVYEKETTAINLVHVGYEDESEEYLSFVFGMSYDIPDSGVITTLSTPNIQNGETVSDTEGMKLVTPTVESWTNVYEDAAYLSGTNWGEQFVVNIKSNVCRDAGTELIFQVIGFTDIYYEKGPANHEDDIPIDQGGYIGSGPFGVQFSDRVDNLESTAGSEPISVAVDSDKIDASNPALEDAVHYVGERMATFNKGWETIAPGNSTTRGKVTALESVASVAMENIRLDLYRLEYRMLLDGNVDAVLVGGMSHEEIDGEVWLTEWESSGQPYILHYSAMEGGRIDWKTICMTNTEEIGMIYAENKELETQLGLDKYTIAVQELYEKYLKENTVNTEVDYSILNGDADFYNQPLEITEDPMSYQERLDWVKSGTVYTEKLEDGGESPTIALGQWQEEDGCLAYVWQYYGSPHPGVCFLTIRFKDGTQARLPLPNEQTNRTAKPASMVFRDGKFLYDVQLDSEWPEDEDIQKRMYHYELDLAFMTLSLSRSLELTGNTANSTVSDAMLAAVEAVLSKNFPMTISMTVTSDRFPVYYPFGPPVFDAWDSINGRQSCRGILDHTYQKVDSIETSDTSITLKFTWQEVDWELTFYDGTDSLLVWMDGTEYYFRAIPNYEDVFLSPLGSLIRRWFDEAEFMALDGYDGKTIVIPNTGQSYLEAAQAWCEAYEGLHLKASSGSKEFYTYVSCRVEAAEGATDMYRERGEIGENTYAFFARMAFVPENEQARQWSMAGNTGNYEGDDPNVPKEALEYSRCGYITLKEDGWHGVIVGTGF